MATGDRRRLSVAPSPARLRPAKVAPTVPKKNPGNNEPPTNGGRNEEVDFRGEKRSNQTHALTSDPDALL